MRRRSEVALCPRCRAVILAGLDADIAALGVHVAPERLTAWGEAMVLSLGLRTFEMATDRRLYARERHGQIRARQASARIAVHAEHTCGMRIPAQWAFPGELRKEALDEPTF